MADEMRRFKGSDEKNPFEAMSERFDRAAQLLGLDPDLYKVMRVPSREIKVYIPVRMDTGHIEVFEGFANEYAGRMNPSRQILLAVNKQDAESPRAQKFRTLQPGKPRPYNDDVVSFHYSSNNL